YPRKIRSATRGVADAYACIGGLNKRIADRNASLNDSLGSVSRSVATQLKQQQTAELLDEAAAHQNSAEEEEEVKRQEAKRHEQAMVQMNVRHQKLHNRGHGKTYSCRATSVGRCRPFRSRLKMWKPRKGKQRLVLTGTFATLESVHRSQEELKKEEEILEAAGKHIPTAKPSATGEGAASQVANAVKNAVEGVGRALRGRPTGLDEDQLTIQRDEKEADTEKRTIEGCVSGKSLLRKNKFRARSVQVE
ncbi:hypothetical protein CSUI_010151, partial [Cystoisospora suis]